jgi:protein ImuB
MRRIISVWLPLWPIERLRRALPTAVPDDAALALVESGSHGIRITAVNACAAAEGVRVGQALADARAGLPPLLSRAAEPDRDRTALLELARWCGRYGPNRNADGEDGLWIDVTGVAHLYGGEERLIADLLARLARFGLTVRAGLADTLGAAHALARFAASPAIALPGETEARVAALPVEALRLAPETVLLLRRLGLKRIGQLFSLPRPALERRFRSAKTAAAVLSRLDEALGVRAEPSPPLVEPPALCVQRSFVDPLISPAGIEAETARLAEELCAHLNARHLGARAIALFLYRADGTTAEAGVGLSFPSREPAHLMALLNERMQHLDAGFGIDALALSALRVEVCTPEQGALGARLSTGLGAGRAGDPSVLIDRLANRLGAARVSRLVPRASHLPERAQACVAALSDPRPAGSEDVMPVRPPRPAFLLASPEPIRVIAEVPEGPPARFTWRRVERRVARAQGPERIAPEWWREIGTKTTRTRDYYRIEDEGGAGYWVFREGLYACEEEAPTWFLHGLFG